MTDIDVNDNSPAGENDPADQPTTDNNQQTHESGVRNPDAYARAQIEKYERLFKKSEERAATLEAQLTGLQTTQQEAIQQELQQIRNELAAEKAAVEQERINTIRVKTLIEAGLAADMVEFVTATDPDQIAEQVKKLSGFAAKAQQRPSKLGNGSSTGVDLSWLPGHPTYRKSTFGE